MHQGALARAGDAGDGHEHAERQVDVDAAQVVVGGAAHPQPPGRGAHLLLEDGAVVQVPPGQRAAGAQPGDGAGEADGAAGRARAGPEVDDVVGELDERRLVLDDEHGVALVAQLQQEPGDPGHVVRVQPGRRLVEDVRHVGEGGAQVAHHLHPLRLAAGERAGGPVQAEVAQPDLGERLQRGAQRVHERGHLRVVDPGEPAGEVADLHRARLGDRAPPDSGRARVLGQPGPAALRARRERDGPLDERPHVRLQRRHVLAEHRPLEPADEPLVREVDAVDLDLRRLLVEQVVPLALGVLPHRLVRVEHPAADEQPAVPALHRVAGHEDRSLAQRAARVDDLVEVDVLHRAGALAPRAHAAEPLEGRAHGLARPPLDGDGAAGPHRRDVEGEGAGRPDVRLGQPAEQHAEQRAGVRGGADGRARVGAEPRLVDDDGRREALEQVDVGARQGRQEALHERAVGLVDHPLRLRGDRAEDERALARARDAGDDGQAPLGDLDVDVAQVVLAGADDPQRVVAVCRGRVVRRSGHGGPPVGTSCPAAPAPRTGCTGRPRGT